MADKTIEQRIKDIIIEQLGVTADQVTPEAKFISTSRTPRPSNPAIPSIRAARPPELPFFISITP